MAIRTTAILIMVIPTMVLHGIGVTLRHHGITHGVIHLRGLGVGARRGAGDLHGVPVMHPTYHLAPIILQEMFVRVVALLVNTETLVRLHQIVLPVLALIPETLVRAAAHQAIATTPEIHATTTQQSVIIPIIRATIHPDHLIPVAVIVVAV